MLNRFSGGIEKWVYGFKFFVSHVHSLVYLTILGFNGIAPYVANFPDMTAAIEDESSIARIRYNNDEDVAVYPSVAFRRGVFNIVGIFDCRNQRTLIPGSGPAGNVLGAPRNPDADLMQQSVYTGYMKFHGLNNLTDKLSNGISFIFQPISARR